MTSRLLYTMDEAAERLGMCRAVHFVGFRDERYWNAVKVWGKPDFIHRGWDTRARREIADGDILIFAKGTDADEPSRFTYNDLDEPAT